MLLRPLLTAIAAFGVAGSTVAADVSLHITRSNGQPVADVVVALVPAAGGSKATSVHAEIDQVNKEFIPLVSAVQTGTLVDFPNSDNTRHQVYSFSAPRPFNLKLYANKPAAPVLFDMPGTVVLGCNIHDHMIAWVRVVDTPWFVTTPASGIATVRGVPDGNYSLSVWHPAMQGEPAGESVQIQGNSRIERRLDVPTVADLRGVAGVH